MCTQCTSNFCKRPNFDIQGFDIINLNLCFTDNIRDNPSTELTDIKDLRQKQMRLMDGRKQVTDTTERDTVRDTENDDKRQMYDNKIQLYDDKSQVNDNLKYFGERDRKRNNTA